MHLLHAWNAAIRNRVIRMLSLLWAALYYLIEPDAAFLAVLIAVLLDLFTKLISILARHGGLTKAIRNGHLSSKKAFLGTFIKLLAYFALGVLCAQVQYVANLEAASVLSKTVVYGFLFTVEAISIVENLTDAGLTELRRLSDMLRKKLA